MQPLQGITERAGKAATVVYDDGSGGVGRAAAAARGADVAIVVVGDKSSEGRDRANLSFSGAQDDLVRAVAAAATRTVVVGINPGPVLLPWADAVDAVLLMFVPGQEAGHALADVLWGDTNPSGRLPVTLPLSEDQAQLTPAQYPGVSSKAGEDFCSAEEGYTGEVCTSNFTERLLVGYRWYDEKGLTPRFPFGHGLSYTSFRYSALAVTPLGGAARDLDVTCSVANIGAVAGAEVAQLYLRFPRSAGEPPQQLKGYVKTPVLAAGATQQLSFRLSDRDFSIWNVSTHAWAVVDGTFGVSIGASSRDMRLTGSIEIKKP